MTKPIYFVDENLISHFSRFTSFRQGSTIIHEGDLDDNVYYILSGRVKVTNYSQKGREIWHSELSTGTFFGEIAALTGVRRSVNIVAELDTKLAVLTKTELIQLVHHDPDIGIWMMQELARRLEERTQKYSEIISYKMSYRIRSELIRLAQECEHSTEETLTIRPVPNFSDIAAKLNTDRENVSREVSILQRKNAVKKTQDELKILKPSLLLES